MPSKAHIIQLVTLSEDDGKRNNFVYFKKGEVQLRGRVAVTLIQNFAYGEVINRMRPMGGSCWVQRK